MVRLRKAHLSLALLTGLVFGLVSPAQGDTILSPTGTFRVGIAPLGNLFDPNAPVSGSELGVGFRRLSDGFDPIRPGTPTEGWGVTAGSVAGKVDPQFSGISNVVANGAPSFMVNSAFISAFLNAGTGNLLQIDQTYSFLADNVLKIATMITNVSSSNQAVSFRRKVDFDLAPPPEFFGETIQSPPFAAPITGAAFGSLEDASPLVSFIFPFTPAGGTSPPGDNGAALQFSVGTLAPGAAAMFDILYGVSLLGQSTASLRTQVQTLAGGNPFILTGSGFSTSLPGPFDSGALGVRLKFAEPPAAIPEPASLSLLGVGLFSLLGYTWQRRLRRA